MSDLRESSPDGATWRELRFDSPRRRNALSPNTVEHLETILTEDSHGTLLIGSTDPTIFSAGADLDIDDEARRVLSDRLYACYELLVARPGVSIAVVEGAAVGGGAQLSTAADLRIAGPAARWRWVGPGHGLAIGAWILPALVGRSIALDLALSGRWVSATEATEIGIASRVDADPWRCARDIATTIAAADPEAVARVKTIADRDGILRSLRLERSLNNETWDGAASR